MGLGPLRPNIVADQKKGEQVFQVDHHKDGEQQDQGKADELAFEDEFGHQVIYGEIGQGDVDGETEQVGLEGIEVIVEVGTPTQEVEEKINRPKNDMVPSVYPEISDPVPQKLFLDRVFQVHGNGFLAFGLSGPSLV